MGTCTKGYIFKKVGKREFFEGISEIPSLKILHDGIKKESNGEFFGFLGIEYKGIKQTMSVFIREKTDEYVTIFRNWEGLEEVKGNITNYGKPQFVFQISFGYGDFSLELVPLILKQFGGVFIPNDCNEENPIVYLKGKTDEKVIFPYLRDVPNIILNCFVRDYLVNGDITKVNSRLHNKIKGMDLLKEFAIRNIDR